MVTNAGKNDLRNFLGDLRVTDLAPGGGINEIHISIHQFSEGGVRAARYVIPQ